ncbi:hypothetical protein ACFW61_22040 [Streptomyces microflavus]|uniref:hypothetical protein n=1 Tax=Streptomyces TaxID=1883 RepID=UPI000B91A320|nr:hypothetical protein [Streptomyces sp. 2R]OXY87497.1 hypothetical protein BEH93_12855 [Streptomyces sp. 2R]
MRRTRPHRRAAALAVAAAVPLLGGCGIQESDVIEAGGPATVEAFYNRNDDVILFFRTPDGRLNPVIRTVGSSPGFGDEYTEPGPAGTIGPPTTEKAVAELLAGPRPEDRAAGLTTALPPTRPGATTRIEPTSGSTVTTHLPFPLNDLNTTALRQLTCTIAYSKDPGGRLTVTLTGQDGASHSDTCGLPSGPPG